MVVETRAPDDRGLRDPSPQRRPAAPGGVLLGLLLVAAGGLWLLAAAGVDVPVQAVAPVVLVVLGLGVLVAAVRGQDDGLVGLAVVLGVWVAIAAVVTALVGVPLTGGVGDRDVTPETVAELEGDTHLFAGSQRVDLRSLLVPEGTTELEISTLLGEVELVVPSGLAVRVDARVGAGSLVLDSVDLDGLGVEHDLETEGWERADRRLDVVLRVGLGEVRLVTD